MSAYLLSIITIGVIASLVVFFSSHKLSENSKDLKLATHIIWVTPFALTVLMIGAVFFLPSPARFANTYREPQRIHVDDVHCVVNDYAVVENDSIGPDVRFRNIFKNTTDAEIDIWKRDAKQDGVFLVLIDASAPK